MEQVILVIHLMLALAIIGLVLLQRSSGGGLGIGGGSGGLGEFATARSTATVLTRLTAIFAALFFCTSLGLGIIAKNKSDSSDGQLFTESEAQIEATLDEAVNAVEDAVQEGMDAAGQAVEDAADAASDAMPELPRGE